MPFFTNGVKILGIETSCDETAVAVVEATDGQFKVLGSALHSQVEMHKEFGGVVPNLAKREHIKNLPIVLEQALKKAGMELPEIELIAVTVGPGLEPALWTGIKFAEELGEKWNKKVVGTNHMEGHIASVLLNDQEIKFPALALLISGGHTELVMMQSWTEKRVIGQTKDDAVGEAFDKVARMLGLPYPGGPEISKLAAEAREKGLNLDIEFPRPMINSPDYNFSFSGLKTAVLYYLRKAPPYPPQKGGFPAFSPLPSEGGWGEAGLKVAREFEDAVSEVLVSKSRKAIREFNPQTFVIGGGVIANSKLRTDFEKLLQEFPNIKLLIPDKPLTTDNAVMIAIAGYITDQNGEVNEMRANGNLKIG